MRVRGGRSTTVVTSGHERELRMDTSILVAELQRPGWVREVGRDGHSQRLCVRDDGLEILDADDDVHALLHVEVFEVFGVDADGGLERLFEHLCQDKSARFTEIVVTHAPLPSCIFSVKLVKIALPS